MLLHSLNQSIYLVCLMLQCMSLKGKRIHGFIRLDNHLSPLVRQRRQAWEYGCYSSSFLRVHIAEFVLIVCSDYIRCLRNKAYPGKGSRYSRIEEWLFVTSLDVIPFSIAFRILAVKNQTPTNVSRYSMNITLIYRHDL